jgi:hypothetical protein
MSDENYEEAREGQIVAEGSSAGLERLKGDGPRMH